LASLVTALVLTLVGLVFEIAFNAVAETIFRGRRPPSGRSIAVIGLALVPLLVVGLVLSFTEVVVAVWFAYVVLVSARRRRMAPPGRLG